MGSARAAGSCCALPAAGWSFRLYDEIGRFRIGFVPHSILCIDREHSLSVEGSMKTSSSWYESGAVDGAGATFELSFRVGEGRFTLMNSDGRFP